MNWIPDYCRKPVLILGCGNVLLGDDGFGPEVVAYLRSHYTIPENVALVDAGTGVTEILLDLVLSPQTPKMVVLVDALEDDLAAGAVRILSLASRPEQKARNGASHQIPTSILLRELQHLAGVEVVLLTVQPLQIPKEVNPGLSPPVRQAVLKACQLLARNFFATAGQFRETGGNGTILI